MADITVGIGSSHSPMLALRGELWEEYAQNDRRNQELVFPQDGVIHSFDEGREVAGPEIRERMGNLEVFKAQSAACTAAIETLRQTLLNAMPDVIVIISDDQDEWFFENAMPSIGIYWGDTVPLRPRVLNGSESEIAAAVARGYGDQRRDHPVEASLGRHLVEYLSDHDFDVAHMTYVPETVGGTVVRRYPTPDGESATTRTTPPRELGLPHGFSFVIKRLMDDAEIPIVPMFQNTCYPPNQVRPSRAYAFGEAIGEAIAAWPSDARVAVVASGGLSHFMVDEELDRTILGALEARDAETLRTLPRGRLFSATSESLNWVALGGAVSSTSLSMSLVEYVPVYRTEVGSGGGWAFAQWT